MLKQKTKVIEAGGVKYRLGKMDARSASYLAMKAAAVIAPALSNVKGMNKQDAITAAANALPSMPREEFDEIQTMLLRTVVKLVETNGVDMPVPVIKADGSFTDEDLCYDAPTVMQLSVQALMFNIGDFFQGAGLIQKPAK